MEMMILKETKKGYEVAGCIIQQTSWCYSCVVYKPDMFCARREDMRANLKGDKNDKKT